MEWKVISENWAVVMMAPLPFLAALCSGIAVGWIVVGLIYSQRLAHQQDLIANLRAVLEDKMPARVLGPVLRARTKKMVIGLTLIFIGLGVALIGAVFATFGGSATKVAVLPSLPGSNANQMPVVPPPQTAPPEVAPAKTAIKVTYTERDVREMLDALTDAHRLIEDVVSPSFFQLESQVVNWQGAIPNMGPNGFAIALSARREKIQTEVWPQINDFVYKTHDRYKDQMRFALALDEEAAKGEVIRALDVAIASVKLIPPNAPPETYKLVERDFKAVANLFNPGVYKWIGTARTRIDEMSKNLRSTGKTGFEDQWLPASASLSR
ncbi:hypothetical protein ABIB00_003076 [Bradyrhizobium sp. LB14.3]|uniref:hypothetical protein n=1 Tax=Bradyrhizobium sp. LB14.3 TaxID=3156328 RepID=UPI00339690C8